jgi:hypothetical protein
MEIFIGRKVGILGDSGESNCVAVCSLEGGLAAVPSASFEATDPPECVNCGMGPVRLLYQGQFQIKTVKSTSQVGRQKPKVEPSPDDHLPVQTSVRWIRSIPTRFGG